jgi:hypothetical protein
MADKRVGGIFASAFAAGMLLAVAIVAPHAWEPAAGPYFGLDDQPPPAAGGPVQLGDGIEAAHAELSLRRRDRAAAPADAAPAATSSDVADRPEIDLDTATPITPPPATDLLTPRGPIADATAQPGDPLRPSAALALAAPLTVDPTAAGELSVAVPPRIVPPEELPPPIPPSESRPAASVPAGERLAIADTAGAAGARAMAAALPTPPATPPHSPLTDTKMPIASGPAAAPGGTAGWAAGPTPPESLKGLADRVQSSQPLSRVPLAPASVPLAAQPDDPLAAAASPLVTRVNPEPQRVAVPASPQPTPPSRIAPPREAFSVAAVPPPADPAPAADVPPPAGRWRSAEDREQVSPLPAPPNTRPGSLGAAPLPGEPWTDPDGVNWSDAIASVPALPAEPDRRRGWLGDRRPESRGQPASRGSRLLDRFRQSDRRIASLPDAVTEPRPMDTAPAAPGGWPRPAKLEQQLDLLAKTALAHEDRASGDPIAVWANQARGCLRDVAQTTGPRDSSADGCLVALGETVIAGMSLADTTADAGLASLTRRAALAVARRVGVWRAGTALFVSLKQPAEPLPPDDAAAAMTRQFHGRAVDEIGRLLEAIERFEVAGTAADARVVKGAITSISGFYPSAARGLSRAVEEHYLAPNVRIAAHQKLLDSLLPAATVDTGPFTDVVGGHEVRGTRTVERKTNVRLVPDDDEICLTLEVHGDIASRSVTESGAVSVTARSASAFVVQKPISIGSRGLLFGDAKGVASNRSRLDAIQTSFDGVPVMGSLVRNMARNQHAETMPQMNREVIDKIISRACREVDSQAEPEFSRIAERVRERVWAPLERLGLEPRAVALETTATTATARLRLAGESQLAAHTPRPRAPVDALLSVQLHESTANNAVERLGLAGRRFALEDLIRTVCGQLGIEPRIPEELPEGVTVAFAETQPLKVECRDGLVHVRVTLDAIESGRRDWYDVIANVAYKPVAKGPQVFLEREGPIQLAGPGHEGRMELALRTIFGKIFPKERPIAVLPEKIAANPRLAGVQATQAVTSDGWIALALEATPAPAVAQPSPAPPPANRPADTRRRPLFR